MYKVGDEVLVKGEIKSIRENEKYPFKVRFAEMEYGQFAEEELFSVGKTYAQGLADAWELARKILMGVTDGGFESREVIDIFGKNAYYTLKELTYEEALAKIEAYEREKEIEVGDVVKVDALPCVVTAVYKDSVDVLFKDGTCENSDKTHIVKTNKHIDIEGLLRQIGE